MARIDKSDLKKWFEAGDQPTEEQFAALIDECYNDDQVEERVKQWVIEQGYAKDVDLKALTTLVKEFIKEQKETNAYLERLAKAGL